MKTTSTWRRMAMFLACGATVSACGDVGTAGRDAADTGGIDPSGGTSGEDGLDDESTAGSGVDLGRADDGGPGEQCSDGAPPAFEIPTDPGCETEPQVGVFTPVVEWTKAEWTVNPGSRQSVTTPIVVQLTDDDLDGDIDDEDMPDVLYVTYDNGGMLRAVAGDGSAEVLSVSVPAFFRTTSIAAADIDGDGIVEIIGIDSDRRVVVFEHDGTLKWKSVGLGAKVGVNDSAPAISDMDGDGIPEIIAGRAILDADGNLLGSGTRGTGTAAYGGASMSFAVDLDDDGQQEVVVGNAVYRIDGSEVWYNGEPDGFPGVADLDGDGTPEIVVVRTGELAVQSSVDGAVLWTTPIPGGKGGPPTIADYDGDGLPEIGVAGSSRYTVWEGDGAELWTNVTQDASSGITGSAVFDFEGDGVADVVYADETRLWVFAGNNGAVKLEFDQHSSGTRLEYPIIADVDGDGEVEIAFVNEHRETNHHGLTVIGDANHSWQPGRKIWNQHAYHITNIDDDGGVPALAEQNWRSFNNFRSGDVSPPDGLKVPRVELFASACEGGCEAELSTLWVQIGNGGAAPLTAGLDVDVLGVADDGSETLLQTIPFADVLLAGQVTDGFAIQVAAGEFPSVRLRATPNEIVCDGAPASVEIDVPPCQVPQG